MASAEGLALASWDVHRAGKSAQIKGNSAARPDKWAAQPLVLIGNAQRKRERCAAYSKRSQRKSMWRILLPAGPVR